MPTDIVRAPSVAYAQGAEPSLQGSASPRSLHMASGDVTQYVGLSSEWDGQGKFCVELTKAGGMCKNTPIEGEEVCVAHKRARDARERKSGGE